MASGHRHLTFVVTNNTNPGLFTILPAIDSSGTLTFELAGIGGADITIQLMDDGGTDNGGVNTSASQTFRIVMGG